MYADDDRTGSFSTAVHDTNDVLAFLFPHYVQTTKVFVCPNTKNFIRESKTVKNPFTGEDDLLDLTGYAGDTVSPGTSYELFGFMNYTADTLSYTDLNIGGTIVRVKGVRQTLNSVLSHRHFYDAFKLKNVQAGPSHISLLLDGDEPPGFQNFPDSNNNHGSAGGNVSFCDGHVSWIPARAYVYNYELSQDENRETP